LSGLELPNATSQTPAAPAAGEASGESGFRAWWLLLIPLVLLGALAEMIGADIGAVSQVVWPGAITHLGGQPGIGRVVLRDNQIATPRHQGLAVRPISLDGEGRFVEALMHQPSAAQ
jgi:hypothetical protein